MLLPESRGQWLDSLVYFFDTEHRKRMNYHFTRKQRERKPMSLHLLLAQIFWLSKDWLHSQVWEVFPAWSFNWVYFNRSTDATVPPGGALWQPARSMEGWRFLLFVLLASFPLSPSKMEQLGELDRWWGEKDREYKGHSTWRWARAVSHGGIWWWREVGGERVTEQSISSRVSVCVCMYWGRNKSKMDCCSVKPISKHMPLVK